MSFYRYPLAFLEAFALLRFRGVLVVTLAALLISMIHNVYFVRTGPWLESIGFPKQMFTVLFSLARTVGWVAQLNEMIDDPTQRIGRPRQIYTGAAKRDYVPIEKR